MRHYAPASRSVGLLPALLLAVVVSTASQARADLDPNESQQFASDGYGVVICGNSYVDPLVNDLIKDMLRGAFLIMTDYLLIDPNNVWVHVDWGQNEGNWTEGLFDDLPATKAEITDTFQTVGVRMWNDSTTPRNLVVLIAGHGGYGGSPGSMRVQLADRLVWDDDFVADCFNQINNNSHGGSPMERLDLLMTMCYGGGLIDDFRDTFHSLRGSIWPNVVHLATVTAGDAVDITTGFFGLQMLYCLAGITTPDDLNGDGVISIYEHFHCASREDWTNPTDPNYTPYVPETIYVPSRSYLNIGGYAEHPLYYEWNAAPPMMSLSVVCCPDTAGEVTLDPQPNDANAPGYPQGTEVELTAIPAQARVFRRWELYDPNHPDDANYATTDTNNPVTIVMDDDRHIRVVFGCSGGVVDSLPILAVGLLLFASRRVRRRR